jgi:light-regulated signal transduction histidine kinase (bacteriophytochrome)
VTPSKSEFAELVGFLKSNNVIEIYARHDLGAQFPPARAFAERAAGVLVVPLSRPARDYLIFFRKEVARTVNWAGDPSKPVIVGRLDERLTPRKSFELWKETVHGQSPAWLSVECRIAEALRVSLLEVILHMSALAEDERTRAQQRQALLIDELNHRVRNILSLIRGIISQSKDPAHTIDSFTEAVGGRIQALARAHDQITADKWAPASFASMLKTEAGAYLTIGADRVNLKGIDVLIEPQAFTTVALVMHEMITNSAKYGALSDQRGRVDVRTSITAEGNLIIQWSEHGGPLVALPKRRGFGSTVIDSIRHDLQGEVELTYAPSGLHARFSIPQMHFRASNPHAGRRENHLGDRDEPAASVPRDVLLVEDTILIALDAEDMMRELGVESVRVTSNATQALSEIAARRPDFALLDVNLGDHKSFEVAERLAELGVRFAFGTGYGNEVRFPAVFASAPKLRKPYVANEIKQIFTTAS